MSQAIISVYLKLFSNFVCALHKNANIRDTLFYTSNHLAKPQVRKANRRNPI